MSYIQCIKRQKRWNNREALASMVFVVFKFYFVHKERAQKLFPRGTPVPCVLLQTGKTSVF
jgi:hypothetical protein